MKNFPWPESIPARLQEQIDFLTAVNELKKVHRASVIETSGRKENSAEHSWHVMLFAEILAEHSDEPVSTSRVSTMLLIHDIVEIDAGDLPLHGVHDPTQAAREQLAADRLFGLLPEDQGAPLRALWDEFELAESADARFAKTLDRLQPVLLNAMTNGGTWPEFDVSMEQVIRKTLPMKNGSTLLWQTANAIYEEGLNKGWLRSS